jgi:hypothetical protein
VNKKDKLVAKIYASLTVRPHEWEHKVIHSDYNRADVLIRAEAELVMDRQELALMFRGKHITLNPAQTDIIKKGFAANIDARYEKSESELLIDEITAILDKKEAEETDWILSQIDKE